MAAFIALLCLSSRRLPRVVFLSVFLSSVSPLFVQLSSAVSSAKTFHCHGARKSRAINPELSFSIHLLNLHSALPFAPSRSVPVYSCRCLEPLSKVAGAVRLPDTPECSVSWCGCSSSWMLFDGMLFDVGALRCGYSSVWMLFGVDGERVDLGSKSR